MKLTIATRESRLALWQAAHVRSRLEALGHDVALLGMTTLGDRILDRTLSKVGGKGLFVKELEVALSEGRADLAVHSLKDVPMDLPDGFELACVMQREDARDAFVSNRFSSLDELPAGAIVGTSSLRRTVLLRELRPDLRIEPLRGNLDTRLAKLDGGHYAAIVLAAAGLVRLGLEQRIRALFDEARMLPAAGQGALGIEIRADRADLLAALAPLAHEPTRLATAAERAVSRAMGGSCSMPLAAHARFVDAATQVQARGGAGNHRNGDGNGDDIDRSPESDRGNGSGMVLRLDAAWGDPALPAPAPPLVRAGAVAAVADLAAAGALGERVAAALCAHGARPAPRA